MLQLVTLVICMGFFRQVLKKRLQKFFDNVEPGNYGRALNFPAKRDLIFKNALKTFFRILKNFR